MTSFRLHAPCQQDATGLQFLAICLAESGGRLESRYWEALLVDLVRQMVESNAEEELSSALDNLFDQDIQAYTQLAAIIEAQTECISLTSGKEKYDIQLFASPVLAWSRYTIPTTPINKSMTEQLEQQLAKHVFADNTRLSLVRYLFSPDQLPRSFHDVWQLTHELGQHALANTSKTLDTDTLPETCRFLSDVRYMIGVVMVPQGNPIFRWNEPNGDRQQARSAWQKVSTNILAPLFTGCAYQPLLADAYHTGCRQADRDARPYALSASVEYLKMVPGIEPEDLQAVVGPCYGEHLEEYRIGLAPRGYHGVFQGVVWMLLGSEDEQMDVLAEIDATLRRCGIEDITYLDESLPMDSCEDCGAPLFPTQEGELVHAEMPEQAESMHQTLH